jgi:glycosyltransferase involved in cell wall biosynthesis
MNIGVDIRVLIDKEYSGVSWYTLDLLTAILTADRENQYFLYYNSFKDLSCRLPEFNQSNIKIFSTEFPNKIFNYFLQKIFHWPKFDKIFGSEKIDIFWSPHINFSSFSKNCKKILTIHDISFLLYPEFFSWRKNFWHRFLGLKKLVKDADTIITISENTKRDVVEKFKISGKKVKVVYPGVNGQFNKISDSDLRKIKEKYTLPDNFIFNIGSFEPRKNIAGLIRAFDVAADKLKDYCLVLAGGRGWKNKEIFSAFAKAKNKNRIKF